MTEERFQRLRAEWLKVKGYLHDPVTGLPALAAVVEEVRRRIEDQGRVGLVYLDLQSEEQLEEIFGWEIYDGLIQQVAAILGELTLETATLAVRGVRSDEFLVFVGSGTDRKSDEPRLGALRDQLVDALMSRLQIQVGHEGPRGIGIHAASEIIRYDPAVRIERLIYRAVDALKERCQVERREEITSRLNELRRILASGDIRVRYQPIVWLADRRVFGFEALSGGPEGELFENSEMLFTFAEKTDHIVELERLCRLRSVVGVGDLPAGQKLFLNCSVHSVEDTEFFSGSFLETAQEVGVEPADVVLEITERVAVTSWKRFRRRLDDLRQAGFSVAIDDMGAGYSSLQTVAEIEPDYLKFDLALVRDIHLSPIKRNLLESLATVAAKIDAQVIAEGVEKHEEFETLKEMRVTFGQGYYFSPPMSLPRYLPEGA